jgi:hypothetical protein
MVEKKSDNEFEGKEELDEDENSDELDELDADEMRDD